MHARISEKVLFYFVKVAKQSIVIFFIVNTTMYFGFEISTKKYACSSINDL
jgi:hypothetical protein